MHLNINPKLEIQLVRIADDVTGAVVDDFLSNPEGAVEFTVANAGEFEEQERLYPGAGRLTLNGFLTAVPRR